MNNANRTEWSPICLLTSMITDGIGRHEVLLPIHRNRYNFREHKCVLFWRKGF